MQHLLTSFIDLFPTCTMLSMTGNFPSNLNISHADSLGFLNKSDDGKDFYTVFSNPPYINSDDLKGMQKENAQKMLSGCVKRNTIG